MTKQISKFAATAVAVTLLMVSGCNSNNGSNNWAIETVDGPHLAYGNNVFTVYATFETLEISGGLTVPIPNMPNSSLELTPSANGGTLVSGTISAADVAALAGTTVIPPSQLPGGRPLPGVPAGSLPAIAVTVPQLDNITFYIGPQVFGLFAPVTFDLNQIIGTFDFYDDSSKLVGQISVVGEDANKANSGFLLMLNIADTAKSMIDAGKLKLPLQ
jgi:hypothetical protein